MINRIYKINKSEDDLNASDKVIVENKKILLDYFMKAHNKINEFIRSEKSNKNKDINDGKGSVLIAHSVIIKINDFIEYINNLKDEHKIVISDQDDEISEMIYKLDLILKYVDKCSISTSEGANSISIHYNIPYPDLVLSNLLELSSDKILFCSGTKHDDYTMKNLFGLNFDKMVYGRRDQSGTLTLAKPKHSMVEVTYKNWQNDEFQEYYEKLLKYIVEKLNEKGDTLVLTPAKKYVVGLVKYLRSKNANVEIDFSNYNGGNDGSIKIGNRVGNKVTVSYRMKRGIDLKGDKCRVLIWTKYPYIDVSDGYVQALFNRFGKKTWIMLNNMANMDSVQGVCRGLRNDEDYCVFATPDSKVYGIIEKWWNEQLRVKEGK